MIRYRSLITTIALAMMLASAVTAEAGGRRRAPPKPPATTRTIVNSTTRSWFTYIYSGTGPKATTVGEATKQGAKVISPGQKAVFNVLPNAGGNQFGDNIKIIAVPPLDVSAPSSPIGSWPPGSGNDTDYPGVQAGKNFTITITETSPTATPDFTPAP